MTNTAKGHKPYRGRSKLREMDAFDKLPQALREALRNADHNYAARHCLSIMRRKNNRMSQAQIIEEVSTADARMHRKDAERGLVCPGQR